ncbi:peptidase M28 [Flavobacterium psychrotolerans]|uniref:Vacuolar membrane protease n=2 Tax=Flavobacterium psychrotolerans TaxID=2169410 RepID=A0A2U1JN82_9FLAO|nr:peptidase M28 [Flavobacterium psychrotolerans]
MMPQWVSNDESLSEFSTHRALNQIKILSEKPHYVGSENHDVVAHYLEKQLQKLGLETKIQEGTTLSDWGNLVKSKNILARIKGTDNSKALLLLSHYDSAPHSFSHGASDDASGIATILEGLRAFLHNKTPHKNDIIVLFSDAEELGLNGAALFVTQSDWTKDIGLALNFEARGTSGPSYMLMEVNQGNAALVQGFTKANPKYPVSNSLMYSIYKMLPNDTDLTVFREQGKIQGFNFAFIDNHFNYHTVQDDYSHVKPTTVAHQGTYLMPLLNYFSNADLTTMDATEDYVYFNTPFCFVSYPFAWILPLCYGALALFLLLVFIGLAKRILIPSEIGKGFLLLFGAVLVSGAVTFVGWKIALSVYPQYNDILQGFTYNGHAYIAAFICLSLAIAFLFYTKSKTEQLTFNHALAPLFLWIAINFGIAIYLPGAGFFIIPVFFGLLMLAYFVLTQKTNKFLNLFLSVPALLLFIPFLVMFPIGLGLKILAGSAVLTILVFGLLLPVFGTFPKKGIWAALLFALAIGCFTYAHLNSNYEVGKAKPNSLLYVVDGDQNKAYWTTYDTNLDQWTKIYLGENPKNALALKTTPLFSKYNSQFTFMAEAPMKKLAKPTIEFLTDSIAGAQRYLKIKISPNRKVNRYDIFANENMVFYNLKGNNAETLGQKDSLYQRNGKKIMSYYVVDNKPLELEFSISKNTSFDMDVMESSFDLMTNPLFTMEKRTSWMMPTPFVLNDAVVIKQKIKPTAVAVKKTVLKNIPKFVVKKDSLIVVTDTLKIQ